MQQRVKRTTAPLARAQFKFQQGLEGFFTGADSESNGHGVA
jgi:hypothetical protein